MESSRNSSSSGLPEQGAAALAPAIPPGAQLALGLSGGVDSVALLSILLELAPALRFSLRAVHVNHGISPNAGRWAEFCSGLCGKSQVPLQLETVDLSPYRSLGLEGAARQARHEVFARLEADFVVLAQHRDDQAETLLLRLLRGAGLRGLAARSPSRSLPGSRARLLRPLLEVSRAEIEAYARLRGLDWIEDESNADTARRRNFLRREAIPLLERQFPAASATVARAAVHLAEARELLEEMARADLERCGDGAAVEIHSLRQLGEARAKNLLRHWCEARGIQALAAARARRSAEVQTGRRAGAEPGEAASGAGHRARAAGRRAIAAGFAQAAAHAEESVSGARHSAVAPRPPAPRLLRRGARFGAGHRGGVRIPGGAGGGGPHRDMGAVRLAAGTATRVVCAARRGKTARIRVPRPPAGAARSTLPLCCFAISATMDNPSPQPSPPVAATR